MKKFHILNTILLFFALPLVFTACRDEDEDIVLDFDITVPDNWEYRIYANEGFIYGAAREPENSQDTILEALYIIKESYPDKTLDLYYTGLKNYISKSNSYDSLLYESDTMINETHFKKMLSNEQWRHITFDYDTFFLDALTTRYFFYENDFGYNMVFISLDSTFYRNQPIFNDIMSTFQYKY